MADLPVPRSPMISSRWPRPIGIIESRALMPVCSDWRTPCRATTFGAIRSTGAASGRLDRAFAVDGLAEPVDDSANERVADWDLGHAAGASGPDRLP